MSASFDDFDCAGAADELERRWVQATTDLGDGAARAVAYRCADGSAATAIAPEKGATPARLAEMVERSRQEAQTILARDLPAAVEKLGALYDHLDCLPPPEDTAGWAALSGKLIPEVLTVRSLLATVSLCFTFGVPGTSESGAASYQTDVLVQVTELTKTLTDLISDVSPLTCSRSIAEFKSEM